MWRKAHCHRRLTAKSNSIHPTIYSPVQPTIRDLATLSRRLSVSPSDQTASCSHSARRVLCPRIKPAPRRHLHRASPVTSLHLVRMHHSTNPFTMCPISHHKLFGFLFIITALITTGKLVFRILFHVHGHSHPIGKLERNLNEPWQIVFRSFDRKPCEVPLARQPSEIDRPSEFLLESPRSTSSGSSGKSVRYDQCA